jgi:hypothetical protein
MLQAVLTGIALFIIGIVLLPVSMLFWGAVLMIVVGAIIVVIGILGMANRV